MAIAPLLTSLQFVGGCTFVGGLIDFWLGKSGQRRARDWLEIWWYRLADVQVRAVGIEEARFATAVMDSLFGRHFLSMRRLHATVFYIIAVVLLGNIVLPYLHHSAFTLDFSRLAIETMYILMFPFYVSMSRWVTSAMGTVPYLFGSGKSWLATISVFVVQGAVFLLIMPYFYLIFTIIFGFLQGLLDNIAFIGSADNTIETPIDLALPALLHLLAIAPEMEASFVKDSFSKKFWTGSDAAIIAIYLQIFYRFVLFGLFVLFYALVPLRSPILRLWARVVEHDSPVFTLIFAGLAATASGIAAAVKALH